MTDISKFIKKWHNRVLEDCGSYVSKEFHSFQLAFINQLRKIAKNNGAEVVNPCYGHYDISCFIKKNGKFVYLHYDNTLNSGRNVVCLMGFVSGCHAPMLIRTVKGEKDYSGGENNFCQFENCEELINNLLNDMPNGN